MKALPLLGLGTLTLLAGLVVHAPAATVQAWLTPKDAPAAVQLMGISGTVTQGSANRILVNGQPVWGELQWQLKPLHLLLARLAYEVEGRTDQTLLQGDVSLLPTGHLHIKPLRFSGTIKPLLELIGQRYLPLEGLAKVDAQKVVLSQGWPLSADGSFQIENLAWTLARDPVRLGNFAAEVKTETGVVTAKLKSLEGPLELDGEAVAKPDRSYRVQVRFRPRGPVQDALRALLTSAGTPDAQGYHHITQEGKIP